MENSGGHTLVTPRMSLLRDVGPMSHFYVSGRRSQSLANKSQKFSMNIIISPAIYIQKISRINFLKWLKISVKKLCFGSLVPRVWDHLPI